MPRADPKRATVALVSLAGSLVLGGAVLLVALRGGGATTEVAFELVPVPAAEPDAPVESTPAPVSAELAASDAETHERSAVATAYEGAELAAWAGQLVDRQSGRPVGGGTVRLLTDDFEATAESGVDGRFELAWPSDVAARVEVVHESYVDLRRPEVDLDSDALYRLEASGSLAGHVESLDRRELGGLTVHLWNDFGSRTGREDGLTVATDVAGRFEFPDLLPGGYAVGLAIEGAPLVFETGLDVIAGRKTDVRLTIDRGVAVRGRVVRAGSELAVPGARVEAQPEAQGATDEVEALVHTEAVTDEDGGFTFETLSIGRVDLTVTTPWGARVRRTIAITAELEGREHTISVHEPAQLAGRVLDLDADSVPHASVALARSEDARGLAWGDTTALADDERVRIVECDADGRFDFGEVPAGDRLTIAAYPGPGSEGLAGGEVVRLQPAEVRRDLLVTLAVGHALEGRVTDVAGEPIAGVDVRVLGGLAGAAQTTTGANGGFRLPAVPEGVRQVRFEKEGFQSDRRKVLAGPEADAVEVELLAVSEVRGWVVDEEGFAVPDARVRATNGRDEDRLRRGARADEFGRFVLDDLEDGDWDLSTYSVGFEDPNTQGTGITVPGVTFVTLTMRRRPIPERASLAGEIALYPTGETVAGLTFDGTRGGSVRIEGTRFRITGMKPGPTRLIARAQGVEPMYFESVDLAPGGHVELGRVEVRRTSRVRVRVVDGDGKWISHAKVRLYRLPPEEGGAANPVRRYELKRDSRSKSHKDDRVPRYKWRLGVSASNFASASKVVRVQEGTETFEVVLEPKKKKRRK